MIDDPANHHFEALVTPAGFGSEIKIDGFAVPMVRSFRICADVNGASLEIDVLPEALATGEVRALRLFSSVFVVTDVHGVPYRSFGTESAANEYVRSTSPVVSRVVKVPFEVVG